MPIEGFVKLYRTRRPHTVAGLCIVPGKKYLFNYYLTNKLVKQRLHWTHTIKNTDFTEVVQESH